MCAEWASPKLLPKPERFLLNGPRRPARLVPIDSLGFTILLGGLAALPPLAIDMSLPALTHIGRDLRASSTAAGLTLSLFLAGFALAQLVLGPLSDGFGRRPVLLGGLALFTSGGIGCATSHSISHLILWRLIEGAGAAAGTVMAFAIVRDLFAGAEMRRKLSYVATVLPLAPMIAPSLGSLVLLVAGWRAIYALLAAAGFLLITVVATATRETRANGLPRRAVARAYSDALLNRRVGGYAAANALSFAMMFAWVSGSPLVLIHDGRVSPLAYAAMFACTSGGLLIGAWISGYLARRQVPAHRPTFAGLAGAAAGSLGALALLISGAVHPLTLIPTITFVMVCRGLATPNLSHGALEPLPAIAGVVSAVLGFSQMAAGAAISAAVAAIYPAHGPVVVAAGMAVCAAAALTVGRWASAR